MKASFPKTLLTFLILALTAVVFPALANNARSTSTATAFADVLERYEIVRLALTNDTTDGVSENSKAIEAILHGLSTDWSPAAAGVRPDKARDVQSLLPELSQAAAALTRATSLEAARDAFYDLSKPLVRWRKATIETTAPEGWPTVAYCPMAKRSWLQPAGEIGNPYHGQSMLRCGATVDG